MSYYFNNPYFSYSLPSWLDTLLSSFPFLPLPSLIVLLWCLPVFKKRMKAIGFLCESKMWFYYVVLFFFLTCDFGCDTHVYDYAVYVKVTVLYSSVDLNPVWFLESLGGTFKINGCQDPAPRRYDLMETSGHHCVLLLFLSSPGDSSMHTGLKTTALPDG